MSSETYGGVDLVECLEVAEAAAAEAGRVIREAWDLQTASGASRVKEVKSSFADLVTETDQKCEHIVVSKIRERFPTHKFIGEEEAAAANRIPELTDEPTWVIDPLDGTTNFVHRYPFVCVCVGLVVNKEPVVGVVYNPILGEMFKARRGGGATLNGEPISVSSPKELREALVASEIGTTRDPQTVEAVSGRVKALMGECRSIRLSGSCACNIASIACGRLDAFYEIGYGGPWDVAAAVCILQESGGAVLDPEGTPFHLMSRRVLAGNGQGLAIEVARVISRAPKSANEPQAMV